MKINKLRTAIVAAVMGLCLTNATQAQTHPGEYVGKTIGEIALEGSIVNDSPAQGSTKTAVPTILGDDFVLVSRNSDTLGKDNPDRSTINVSRFAGISEPMGINTGVPAPEPATTAIFAGIVAFGMACWPAVRRKF